MVAVEQKDETLLGGLRDRVYFLAFAFHGQEHRRGGKIAVPKIVSHSLKMPDAFARLGVQSDQAICKQIVPDAVGAVEIKRR